MHARVAPAIMFHHFHGADHAPTQGSISAVDLEALLEHVGRRRLLPAREWLERLGSGRLEPSHVCLTLDDNLLSQRDVALPVLERHGLTAVWSVATGMWCGRPPRVETDRAFREATFASVDGFYAAFESALGRSAHAARAEEALATFVPGEYLCEFAFYSDADRRYRFVRDRVLRPHEHAELMDQLLCEHGQTREALAGRLWMSKDDVRLLHERGHVLALHSHTHPTRLAALDEYAQRDEYEQNASALADVIGERPIVVAHPCNSYHEVTLRVLREMGVRFGFRSHPATGPTLLELPRIDHADLMKEVRACV